MGNNLNDIRDIFLSQLIGALRKGRLNPTAEDVADILWLAAYKKSDPRVPEPDRGLSSALPEEGVQEEEGSEREEETESAISTEGREQGRKRDDGEVPVYPLRSAGWGKTRRGTPIRIPGARALPGTIEITRALRPLMRRVPSRRSKKLDEAATARRIAEDGLWIPVFSPAPERWLSLELVVDDSPSMQIWRRAVEELKTLLSGLGAFQAVRSWSLATGNPETVTISTACGSPGRSTLELLDIARRRLLLIVTDCVAPAWRSVQMRELLEIWAASQPMALIQLLPQRLWSRTGLACASLVRVRALEPGVASGRLKVTTSRPRRRWHDEARLPIPITTLEPAFVASWARLVGGIAGQAPAAIFYPEVGRVPSAQARSAEDRLRAFRSSASPLAFRLTCLLAAAPLSLPVMRMVQRVMLPHSRQSHLAEFFLSGLLRRRDDNASGHGYDEIFYDFCPGIRGILLDAGEIPDAVQVQRILSRHVESRFGQVLDFQAVLNDPEGATLASLDRMNPHFTTISAMVLKRLGGIYARAAERIVDSFSTGADPTSSSVTIVTKSATKKTRKKGTKIRTTTTPSPQDSARQLERSLWSAAEILRGSIYTSDFKGYLFCLFFLKRVSDRFDEECEALIDEGIDPENRDKHQFFVPKRARWPLIMKTTENLGEVINKALSALEEDNPGLEDVLTAVDFNDERGFGDSHQRDTTLHRLVQHFSKVDLKNSNLSEPDTLGRAYEYLLERFANDAGKKGGELYTPHQVARLIVEILDLEEGMRICDPACGSGGILIQCAKHLVRKGASPRNLNLYGQEKNHFAWAICKMNMLLHDQADAVIERGDSIRDPRFLEGGRLMRFDRVIASPPFSLARWGREIAKQDPFERFRFGIPPRGSGDLAFVQHMVALLNAQGKLGVVIPNGALFRGASEARIRRGLIEEDLVEVIVSLPPNLFYGTSIPAAVLVVSRYKADDKKGKVLFVEASREFRAGRTRNSLRDEDVERIVAAVRSFQSRDGYARIVDVGEIERNDFKLTVDSYVDTAISGKHSTSQYASVLVTPVVDRLRAGAEYSRAEDISRKPAFRSQEAERHARRLEELYNQRTLLINTNRATRELDAEIRDLRRLLRSGPRLEPGEFLLDGRFQLVELLGKGGFATVWKAYDRSLQRLVAAKILHGQHSEERTLKERFFRGSRRMAELIHPHIVRVLERELDDDGWFFFVMELVPGGDFGRAVLEGKLRVEERLRIICATGEALEFAHERGVIHRDVKPTNILLGENLQPKLTDFDLIRDEDSTGFTQTGAMLGTLNYAAPETLEAPKEAGVEADVYSLASTAVFALQGGPLPRGYYRDPAGAIAELRTSAAVAQVLTQATAWEPRDRFASVAAFVSALQTASASPPDPSMRPIASTTLKGKKGMRTRARTPDNFEDLFLREGLWCEIPAGVGWMGSPESERGRRSDEGPRHQVEIQNRFWLASIPVTNVQFAAFDNMPLQKPEDGLQSLPRVNVSWHSAVSFCRWLSEEGLEGARLPTEEEWEYACRAGTETAYWNGNDENDLRKVGWFAGNSAGRCQRVGRKARNPWGLFDMHGNIWEWTASAYDAEKYQKRPRYQPFPVDPTDTPADLTLTALDIGRVFRGGSFRFNPSGARAACRDFRLSRFDFADLGFRVLLPFAPSCS